MRSPALLAALGALGVLGGASGDAPTARASPATVGVLNSCRGVTTIPALWQRDSTRMLRIESPPSAKKLSSTPTRSAPRTAAQISASARSVSVRGATYAWSPSIRSGAGSARRSSFPLWLRGNRSSATNADGTR